MNLRWFNVQSCAWLEPPRPQQLQRNLQLVCQWLFVQILLKFVVWIQSSYCSQLILISNCTVAKMFDISDYDSMPGCPWRESRPLRNSRPGSFCNKMLHIFTDTLQQRLSKQPPKPRGVQKKKTRIMCHAWVSVRSRVWGIATVESLLQNGRCVCFRVLDESSNVCVQIITLIKKN